MLRLTRAKLIGRNTKDGTSFIWEHVPLGKVYWVDVESLQELNCGNLNQPGTVVKRWCINFYDNPQGIGERGWMPMELLEIEKT